MKLGEIVMTTPTIGRTCALLGARWNPSPKIMWNFVTIILRKMLLFGRWQEADMLDLLLILTFFPRHERRICPGGCGRDKSSDPISAFLKQEVHFQNIEHMANGCQQPGFHSFYHRKTWNTLDLLQMLCWMVWITTL